MTRWTLDVWIRAWRRGGFDALVPAPRQSQPRTPPEVLEQRKRAVERVISTTNWTDRFINADKFPQILAEPNPERFRRPPPPVLDERQRQLVGY